MKETLKGTLLVFSSALMFAFIGIFIRFISLPSIIIVFFFFFISGIVMLSYFLLMDRSKLTLKKMMWPLFLLALWNVLNNVFYFQSIKLTTIGNAVFTHFTAPLFVALLAPFFLKEKFGKYTLWALFVSLAGVFLVTFTDLSFGSQDFTGILFGLASGLMFAAFIMTTKHLASFTSPYTIIMYNTLIGSLFLLPFLFIVDFHLTVSNFALVVVFALVIQVFAALIYVHGLKYISSAQTGIISYFEPVAAVSYAWLFFREPVSAFTIAGGALVIFGGYLIVRETA